MFQSYKIQDCTTLIWAWSFWDFEKVLFFDSDFNRDRTAFSEYMNFTKLQGQWKQVGRLGILEEQKNDQFIFGHIYT